LKVAAAPPAVADGIQRQVARAPRSRAHDLTVIIDVIFIW
jgi:hypothetical protein